VKKKTKESRANPRTAEEKPAHSAENGDKWWPYKSVRNKSKKRGRVSAVGQHRS